jgi:hypothetical protein
VFGNRGGAQEQIDARSLGAGTACLIGEHGHALFMLAKGSQRAVELLPHGFVVRLCAEDMMGVDRHLGESSKCLAALHQPAVPKRLLRIACEGEELGSCRNSGLDVAEVFIDARRIESAAKMLPAARSKRSTA